MLAKISFYAKPNADEIITLKHNEEGEVQELSLDYRPFLFEFLDDMNSKYELIIYSRLNQNYTNAIVDIIHRKKKYFSYVFYDTFCLFANISSGVKCIDFLYGNRTDSDIVAVDISDIQVPFNEDNFVSISRLDENDFEDQGLVKLAKLLDVLYEKSDVKSEIASFKYSV